MEQKNAIESQKPCIAYVRTLLIIKYYIFLRDQAEVQTEGNQFSIALMIVMIKAYNNWMKFEGINAIAIMPTDCKQYTTTSYH